MSEFVFAQQPADTFTDIKRPDISFECPKKTIKIAFQDFGVFYNSASKTGIDREIVELLKSRTGCKFSETVLNPSQIWSHLRSGKVDIGLSSINNAKRSKITRFAYYGTARSVVIHQKNVHASTAFEFSSNQKLKIGIVKDTSYGSKPDIWLNEMISKGKVKEFKTEKDLAQALIQKRISVIMTFKFVYQTYIPNQQLENYNVTVWFPEAESHGLAFSKKTIKDGMFRAFEGVVSKAIAEGELKNIAAKFLPPEEVSFYAP